MRRIWFGAALGLLAISTMPVRPEPANDQADPPRPEFPVTELRVMSYNVKGLPWPVTRSRTDQLADIGRRLKALRIQGKQPHIILVQEAFTQEAKAIGAAAGYRYTAWGPGPGAGRLGAHRSLDASFAAQASGLKGEGLGQWLDSGLAIFSDFPLVARSGYAFPEGACAGFDCLAAKGVQFVEVAVPGQPEPLSVINTHLNSDVSSSGVDEDRTDAAFLWQYSTFRDFVERRLGSRGPAIVGGDVNIGPSERRWAYAERTGTLLADGRDSVGEALGRSVVAPEARAAAGEIHRKRIDRLFYRPGETLKLTLASLEVPFATGAPDSLSDHAGFLVTYRIEAQSETRLGRDLLKPD